MANIFWVFWSWNLILCFFNFQNCQRRPQKLNKIALINYFFHLSTTPVHIFSCVQVNFMSCMSVWQKYSKNFNKFFAVFLCHNWIRITTTIASSRCSIWVYHKAIKAFMNILLHLHNRREFYLRATEQTKYIVRCLHMLPLSLYLFFCHVISLLMSHAIYISYTCITN